MASNLKNCCCPRLLRSPAGTFFIRGTTSSGFPYPIDLTTRICPAAALLHRIALGRDPFSYPELTAVASPPSMRLLGSLGFDAVERGTVSYPGGVSPLPSVDLLFLSPTLYLFLKVAFPAFLRYSGAARAMMAWVRQVHLVGKYKVFVPVDKKK